jgi:hypothetical protein
VSPLSPRVCQARWPVQAFATAGKYRQRLQGIVDPRYERTQSKASGHVDRYPERQEPVKVRELLHDQ